MPHRRRSEHTRARRLHRETAGVQVRPAAGEIDDAEGGASGRPDAEGEKNMLFEIEDVENYSDI